VPIRQFLGDVTFPPDDVLRMSSAFTAALSRLGLNDRGTATALLIAVSSLAGFPTPAAGVRGTVSARPASENLHISGHR
jgi:hypothetical protein